jgi:hypothetical protein
MTREAMRQQMMLRALIEQPGAGLALQGWIRSRGDGFSIGLNTYRANAAALAARALSAAYPTIAQLVGDTTFTAMARDLWRQAPPQRGDIGEWGAALPAFIEQQPSLADEPYLADSARLDWAVHMASRAANTDPAAMMDLDRLAKADPDCVTIALAPGTAVLTSAWPIAAIWHAHQRSDAQRFDAVRRAFAAQAGEHALVVREGLTVAVHTVSAADASFTKALLTGHPLAHALDTAGDAFALDQWLVRALAGGWLRSIHVDGG